MTTNTKKTILIKTLLFCFILITQIGFSQKNNTIVNPKVTYKPPVKVNKIACNCDKIDFEARIIKLETTNGRGKYKLQIIDFINKSGCEVKWLNLYWKDHPNILFSSMKNQNFEKNTDGSVALYEFEFETRLATPELEDGAADMISFYIQLGEKKCLIKDKKSTYFRQM